MTTDVPKNLSQDSSINPVHDIVDGQTTDCCIVGGGPAGAVLALNGVIQQKYSVNASCPHASFRRFKLLSKSGYLPQFSPQIVPLYHLRFCAYPSCVTFQPG